jgi:hypothetical protein
LGGVVTLYVFGDDTFLFGGEAKRRGCSSGRVIWCGRGIGRAGTYNRRSSRGKGRSFPTKEGEA